MPVDPVNDILNSILGETVSVAAGKDEAAVDLQIVTESKKQAAGDADYSPGINDADWVLSYRKGDIETPVPEQEIYINDDRYFVKSVADEGDVFPFITLSLNRFES